MVAGSAALCADDDDAVRLLRSLLRGESGEPNQSFAAPDGERVSVIVFASKAAHDAWRDDERHRAAQQRGRVDWYAEYHIQVCELLTEWRWEQPG